MIFYPVTTYTLCSAQGLTGANADYFGVINTCEEVTTGGIVFPLVTVY